LQVYLENEVLGYQFKQAGSNKSDTFTDESPTWVVIKNFINTLIYADVPGGELLQAADPEIAMTILSLDVKRQIYDTYFLTDLLKYEELMVIWRVNPAEAKKQFHLAQGEAVPDNLDTALLGCYRYCDDAIVPLVCPADSVMCTPSYQRSCLAPDGTAGFQVCRSDCNWGSCDSLTSVTYTLTINVVGNGIVTTDVSCCTYTAGTQAFLVATPDVDALFSGWTGACSGIDSCTITMDSDKEVTATFEAQRFPLQGSITGGWSGSCSDFSVSGTFSFSVSENGSVNGSFSGNDSGPVTGSVNSTGDFSAAVGSAGEYSWSGQLSLQLSPSESSLVGSGSWTGAGCSGGWSGIGPAS
jgi:hypothetical protein